MDKGYVIFLTGDYKYQGHAMNKFFLWMGLSFFIFPAQAQEPICPAKILLSLSRSGSACFDLARNEACYGNGTVESTFQGEEGAAFTKPGDIVEAGVLQSIHVTPLENDISIASLYIQASLTDNEERSVTLLLLGDTEVQNNVPPLPEIVITATGALNIRHTPEINGEIVERLAINKTVIANGRTEEGDWLRVKIPNTNDLGWIGVDVGRADGDVRTLSVVGIDTPVYRPFQVLTLKTQDYALCDGALNSGLLLQTPNTFTAVDLIVNGIPMRLAATAFLQAQPGGNLTINVLQGQAELNANNETQFVPAGARASIPIDADGMATNVPSPAEPYDMSLLRGLPLNSLPARLTLMDPLTPDGIEAAIAQLTAVEAIETQEAVPVVDTSCRRQTTRSTTLWAGPGLFYDAVNNIPADSFVRPVFQTTDADQNVWWQLSSSNWVQTSDIAESGECDPIPVTNTIRAPRMNTLSLETCESRNGPLRVGQEVTIEFIPPPWNNLGEARDAVRTDPGSITVGAQRLRVYASDPIRLGTADDRYLRTFSANWVAPAGTYRIEGKWLSYLPTCTITVPVG
jgi:hypothetical protein